MRIAVGQIYIKPGINYPFSLRFQAWLGQELTNRVEPSEMFRQFYDGYDLVFRVSAKSGIAEPEIKGPTVFKRDKSVEFTVFLPYKVGEPSDQADYRGPLKLLFDSIANILQSLGIETSRIVESVPFLIEHVISTPAMINYPKGVEKPF